jgi:Uncharacterized iron-regulated membrane protein
VNLRSWRKIHKWVSIFVGVFFLIWTISGIVMILPIGAYDPVAPHTATAPDFSDVTTSPAAAIAALSQSEGGPQQVTGLSLSQIETRTVYVLTLADESSRLIDAHTGQLFTIDQALAERIALDDFAIAGPIFQVTRLDQHEASYPSGVLPVFRIIFESDHLVAYYVSGADGVAQRSDNWSRARNAISSLHTFEPLTLITKREKPTQALLVFVSLVGIVTALTGYYLALPRRRAR